MGDFNVSCGVSKMSIGYNTRVFVLPLLEGGFYGPIAGERGEYYAARYKGNMVYQPAGYFLYPTSLFNPLCFPIEGIYNGYGGINDIVKDKNVACIEKFTGISIEVFSKLILTDRRDVWDTYSEYYEVFFLYKKEVYMY